MTQRSLLQQRLAVVPALVLAVAAAAQARAADVPPVGPGKTAAAQADDAGRSAPAADGESAVSAEADALLGEAAEGGSAPADEGASAATGDQKALVDQALEAEGLPLRERDEAVDAVMDRLLAPVVDKIVVDGTVLPGRVVRLSAEGIVVETDYGEGTIEVPYSRVDELETLLTYRVLYGVNDRARGRLLGIEDGVLLVGSTRSSASPVPLESIQRGVSDEEYRTSNLTRLRTDLRYWTAGLELGLNIENGAIEKNKINVGAEVQRARAPWLFVLEARYAFESQQRVDETEPRTTKDEFWGQLRLQRDIWKRTFAFGAFPGEFDTPRGIDGRIYPNAGLGYAVWKSDRVLVELSGGFGYVYEEFRDFGKNDYASGLLGLDSRFELPRGAVMNLWVYYLPGLVDAGRSWLFRGEFSLSVPIWDPLALLFRVTQVYDNNPSPEVGNNKTVTTLGFTLNF